MLEPTTQSPGIETFQSNESPIIMSGDSIIEHPDLVWDTTVVVPKNIHDVWSGRFGITRMGAVGDGYAGLLLPQRFDPILPEHLRSLPADAPEPKRLQVGDTAPDGHKDDRSTVVQLDEEAKTIVFETRWTSKTKEPALHYTWQVTASEGSEANTTLLTARTRMENVKHHKVGKLLWPLVDRYAMRILGEGISRDDSLPISRGTLKQRLGTRAIAAAGELKANRDRRKASER